MHVAHEALRQKINAFLKSLTDQQDMPSEEVLAVAAYLVGQLIALQDQRKFTSDPTA